MFYFVGMETPLPKKWKEKLSALEVGGTGELVDNRSTVYAAIRDNFSNSEDPELKSCEFSVRTNPDDNLLYVWRIK